MGEWWQSSWLRRHIMFVPFGVFITTGLLTYFTEPGPWEVKASIKAAASLVDLGTVIYAMVAVLIERGIRMWFWALDQREKWRAKWRAEAEAEGRAEGRVEGRAEGRAEGRVEGQAEILNHMWAAAHSAGNQDLVEELERVAEEKGITLGEPLPQ